MATIEEIRQYAERLEDRIRELELKIDNPITKTEKKTEFVPMYDILRVIKLYASLPIYTTARTDIPKQGEIYITDIGGTRKLNVYINGVQYSATIT